MYNHIIRLIKSQIIRFSERMTNRAGTGWLKFPLIFIGITTVTIAGYLAWNSIYHQEATANREVLENKSFLANISEGVRNTFANMFSSQDGNIIAEFSARDSQSNSRQSESRPFVFINRDSVYLGEILIQSGSGFTPQGSISLLSSSPAGEPSSISISADKNGQFNHTHIISASAETGVHYYWAEDITTGFITDKVKFLIMSSSAKEPNPKEIQEEDSQAKEKREKEDINQQLSLPKECFFAGSGLVNTAKRIVLNEVAWMGSTENHSNEWIELKNISSAPIDISGWWLIDQAEQIRTVFPSNTNIPAGRFYLLERSDDESAPKVRADMIYNGILSNSKEGIRLFNPDCLIEDEVLANPDWPAGNSADRKTMERKTDLSGWHTSSFVNGTPKQANSAGLIAQTSAPAITGGGSGGGGGSAPAPPQPTFCSKENLSSPAHSSVIFNEVAWMGSVPNPEETARQAANNEWIELKNISGQDINLAGWQILDKDNQIRVVFTGEHRITSANNRLFLLERAGNNSAPGATADLIYTGGLSNSDETLYLFNVKCELQDKILANPNWPAGDNTSKRTMERRLDLSWQTSANPGGTPKNINSAGIITQAAVITPVGLVAQAATASPTSFPDPPHISLSYQPQNPVDKEIIVSLSVTNLKNVNHDVKISIEADRVLSEIFNKKENKWQSSFHYLNNFSSETSFPKNFKLRIKDRDKHFRGEADIIAKIRESERKEVFLEFKGKINIADSEQTTSIPNQSQNQSQSPEQPKQEELKIASTNNLLLNAFFDKWENKLPLHWKYGTPTHLADIYQFIGGLPGKYSLGIKHDRTGFRDIEQYIKRTTEDLGSPDKAYGEIQVKGKGYIRIGIKAGQTTFSHSDWKKINNTDWSSIAFDRSAVNTENIWKFRIQTTDRDPNNTIPIGERHRYHGVDLQIGAAWFGVSEPPSNWPFQN